MSPETKPVRCAIYTRKSSEEGLEQSFNSLDAQREAGESFIKSQRHEGWQLLPTQYDDGGYSGGTMDRPGLKKLLEDVEAGSVDVIVVYKVDRLTRSLLDFAKIVETLNSKGVSFVSITQQFNTTTSMGRLTLNILLSFAQFEREVTGERIRDKIAASKRKGMWMGGNPPVGYDVKDRKLRVNQREAQLVRTLFQQYLKLGCVPKLKLWLDGEGIRSKVRKSAAGKTSGGAHFSRGALYKILNNPIYLGQIRHKDQCHPGEHERIIPQALWNQVQHRLRSDNQGRRNGVRGVCASMFSGLIEDQDGNRFTPNHAVKGNRRYRYYVCRPQVRGNNVSVRIPAADIEAPVLSGFRLLLKNSQRVMDLLGKLDDSAKLTKNLLNAAKDMGIRLIETPAAEISKFIRSVIARVVIYPDKVRVAFRKNSLRSLLLEGTDVAPSVKAIPIQEDSKAIASFEFAARLRRSGREVRLILSSDSERLTSSRPSSSLLKAAARSYDWCQQIIRGEACGPTSIAEKSGLDGRYVGRIFRHAFLAPDIVQAIVDGRQPHHLSLEKLNRNLPLSWVEQRKLLGFPALHA